MVTISDKYEKAQGVYSVGVFDLVCESELELREFFELNKSALDRGQLYDEEVTRLRLIGFKAASLDFIESLAFRYNQMKRGLLVQADKKLFIDQFGLEAIKAIIYATEFHPRESTVDLYAAAVFHAYEEYGDSAAFSERIQNMSGATSHRDWGAVANQIDLFGRLLNIPFNDPLPPRPDNGDDNE